MRVQGNMQVGEASRWAGRATRRLSGALWPVLLANVIAVVEVMLAGIVYAALNSRDLAPDWGWLPFLLFNAVFAIFISQWVCRRLTVRNFRKALAERDMPNPFHASIELGDDALVAIVGTVEYRAVWGGVSEVFRAGPYWVALAQAVPIYIPRRLFEDDATERDFLAQLLQKLGPGAVDRSKDVSRFLSARRGQP